MAFRLANKEHVTYQFTKHLCHGLHLGVKVITVVDIWWYVTSATHTMSCGGWRLNDESCWQCSKLRHHIYRCSSAYWFYRPDLSFSAYALAWYVVQDLVQQEPAPSLAAYGVTSRSSRDIDLRKQTHGLCYHSLFFEILPWPLNPRWNVTQLYDSSTYRLF